MNLRYIALYMDYDSNYVDPFRDHFNLNSRFVSNYLSIRIRRFKYKTDGTYKMIGVYPSINIQNICRIVGDDALQARIVFDIDKYNQMTEYERYDYYLKLLEDGYRICSDYKNIPLDELLQLHQEFKAGGYKNEWLHQKKQFRSHGIEVILNCHFTSFDFKMILSAFDIKTKDMIISGTVIRTLPDEVCYAPLLGQVVLEGNDLILTEKYDRPKFVFSLAEILDGKFSFEIVDNGLKYVPYEGNSFPE